MGNIRATNIRRSIHQPDQKGIPIRIGPDPKDMGKAQVSAVGTRLVPSLHRRADTTRDNRQVKQLGHAPLILDFVLESKNLCVGELFVAFDAVVVVRVLGDKGTLAEEGGVFY